MPSETPASSQKSKHAQEISAVLRFVREIAQSRSTAKIRVEDELGFKWLDKIDSDLPEVKIGAAAGPDCVLSVTSPLLPVFPEPDARLKPWIAGDPASANWGPATGVRKKLVLEADTLDKEKLPPVEDLADISLRLGLPDADGIEACAALVSINDDEALAKKLALWQRLRGSLPPELFGWVRPDGTSLTCRYILVKDLTDSQRLALDARLVRLTPGKVTTPEIREETGDERPLLLPALTLEEKFEASEKRMAALDAWRKQREAWLVEFDRAERAQKLYQELLTFQYGVDASNLTEEFVLGNFILETEKSSGEVFRYPLLVKRLAFEKTSNGKTLRLIPDYSAPAEFQGEITAQLGKNAVFLPDPTVIQKIQGLEGLTEAGVELVTGDEYAAHFRAFADNLEPTSRWADDPLNLPFGQGAKLVVYPRAVLMRRKRLTGVPRAIAEMADYYEENPDALPEAFEAMVCRSTGRVERVSFSAESDEQKIAEASGFCEEILLAKPANEDQLKIARELERTGSVLVQGPPGTGKTHTIANLMGHFLSQGLHVLVTSTKAPALTVLKDKLPREMQDLCLSQLDDAKKNFESACSFSERIENADLRRLTREADELARARRETLQAALKKNRAIADLLTPETKRHTVGDRSFSLSGIAVELRKLDAYADLIPGPVSEAWLDEANPKPLPVTEIELAKLFAGMTRWSAGEKAILAATLPDAATLPSPEQVEAWVERERTAAAVLAQSDGITEEPRARAMDGRPLIRLRRSADDAVFSCLAEKSVEVAQAWRAFDDRRFDEILADPMQRWAALAGMDRATRSNDDLLEIMLEAVRKAGKAEEDARLPLNGVTIEPADVLDTPAFRSAFDWLKAEHPDGKPGIFARFSRSDELKELKRVRVSGREIFSADAMKLVAVELGVRDARAEAAKQWNLRASECGAKRFEEMHLSCADLAQRTASLVAPALEWHAKFEELLAAWRSAGVNVDAIFEGRRPGEAATYYFDRIRDEFMPRVRPFLPVIDAAAAKSAVATEREAAAAPWRAAARSFPLVQAMMTALPVDAATYAKAWDAFMRIVSAENVSAWRDWNDSVNRLFEACPGWAVAFRLGKAEGAERPYGDWERAWYWQMLNAIFVANTGGDLQSLMREAKDLSDRFRKLTGELASRRAWIAVAEKTTRDQIASLKTAAMFFRKVGKGTGKKAEVNLRHAARALEASQTAVPAWIMTIDQALSSFRPGNQFDVLIVDEASQADLTSLALLGLAKRAVIVGDDRQVTPVKPGVEESVIEQFKRQYLAGVVDKPEIYELKTSLYEFAQIRYRALALHEHFRCVPSIIGFSNRLCYEGRILPLRPADSTPVQPPMVPLQVEGAKAGDVNEAEGDAIVRLMKACMAEPEYRGKTFGVVVMRSTGSGAQVNSILGKLMKELSPTEFEERRVRVGIAPDFQGDERDVIFLSLVDVPSSKSGFITAVNRTNDLQMKRFNVAVSRAKDQLWIIHSFDWQSQTQADDIRRYLLQHAANCGREQEIEEETRAAADQNSLAFEAPVAKELRLRGYRIRQQYPVGSYRLDIVVMGGGRRVALECDGERFHSSDAQITDDLRRQAVLERCGWQFIRLRGSEYFRDPAAALDRVCRDLEAAGVKPDAAAEAPVSDLALRVLRRAEFITAPGDEATDLTPAEETQEAGETVPPEETAAEVEPESSEEEAVSEEVPEKTPEEESSEEETPPEPVEPEPAEETEPEAKASEEETAQDEPEAEDEEAEEEDRTGPVDPPLDPSVKYLGPNGETWTGRGRRPTWLRELVEKGHAVEEYLVNPQTAAEPRRRKVPGKYVSPDGQVWSGRGRRPRWLNDLVAAGHDASEYLVEGADTLPQGRMGRGLNPIKLKTGDDGDFRGWD
ncbi:H-NS family nucleoid-associated regulatory protein [Sutterella sp.]|uniref:H-NS family nucleoid-associated regulatory protein n=1 Tax=Sutterella sp. TaxID=1981025 RepID=UPI0026DF49AB|nr:H-NS family nucleoid-associated regulatory protein [Sutterella sp.]MDO5532739.1 H-NS family nucleoid-associated regulatory protein [Sutterella sp.]